ncbi:hypothetical protein INT47_009553 [Mucor saturninus]|uniref:Uncharacterized protein n=1 Tax=Mucor saturninus TaxID=64648 RepID=A0A8H7UVU3_9FUNG|nr:hypothetical protein INT47_009553 [Mucor saturninus]
MKSSKINITTPTKLTETQEPAKTKSSKTKMLSRLFKKLARSSKESPISTETQTTQYKLTFVPILNKKDEVVKAETTEIVWYDNSNTISTSTELAQRIWDEDKTVYKSLDTVVEWIGNGKEESNSILESYMSHFDFKDVSLEQAFRTLCSKLYLKGETQQIDRVLLQFSVRYFECNKQCIFGSTDVVHAVVYSLLLLNTDLHVAQGDYKKMTQSAFIANTMSAITVQDSGLSSQSWAPLQRISSNATSASTGSFYTRSLPRTFSSASKSWEIEMKNMLKQMYSNIRCMQIADPSTPAGTTTAGASFRRNVSSIIKKKIVHDVESVKSVKSAVSSTMHYQAIASHLQSIDLPVSYTSNAPYYKEGMISCKHLLESKSQKAKHRDWKECFMVIERSQLRMYKLDNSTTSDDSFLGSGNWMSYAQLLSTIDLKHSLAFALPSGYSRQRQHVFTLQESNGAVHVFQVGSAEQVKEWISTCNYWAARESKEPLVGGVGSMEYGWGHCLESVTPCNMVYKWQPPSASTTSSMLEESAQLQALYEYVNDLTNQLDQHHAIKSKMESYFTLSKFYATAMNNWESRSFYLLSEIIKYQNYCNSIEKSLSLQVSMMA